MYLLQVNWPPASTLLLLPLLVVAAQPEFAAMRDSPTGSSSNSNSFVANANANAAATVPHRLAKRMDLEACIGHFDVHKNTIIRTGESQAIGGKYLQGLELDTIDECERLCCETEACDVYIFERKAGGYCYLFECGPPENFHCKFTRHANYTSAVLTPQVRAKTNEPASTAHPMLPHIPSNNISQQEWELTNLKTKPEVRDKPSAAATAAAATATSSGAAQAAMPQSAPAAAHCGRFQFSCHSGECIAVYNACDGIPQCDDGSDEGPECNAVTSTATKTSNNNNNLVDASKTIANQYPPVASIQQQLQQAAQPQQQQQLQQQQKPQQPLLTQSVMLGPPPPPPPPPPMINNREDASAWANRKMIATAQQQPPAQEEILTDELNSHIFNHKGGLQLQVANTQGQGQNQLAAFGVPTNNNNNNNNAQIAAGSLYGMTLPLPHSSIYMAPQQQQPPQLPAVAPQMPQNMAWPQAAVAAASPQIIQQQQPQQIVLQQQLTQNAASYTSANNAGAQLLPNVAAAQPAQAKPQPQPPQQQLQPQATQQQQHQQQQHQVLLPVLNAAPSNDKAQAAYQDYDDYEEEKSTEAPKKKQRKHKKQKPKTNKDPIQLSLEQSKQSISPVHEQYKLIHDNLAMEFRDHDGHSERPGGAVLSLTLGLLVTAALSILIGCRMRTVGRRARRLGGKTPYSQEADFLVNGMYL